MTPRVLFVGGEKGSWTMRGKQIGAALHARYTAKPTPDDWRSADIIVVIKRTPEHWYDDIRRFSTAYLVWDVLDFWHQPSGNTRTSEDLIREIDQLRRGLKIHVLIGATRKMAADIGGVYIPHHTRIGLTPTPIRERPQTVAYDGSTRYLGEWLPALTKACAARGLEFRTDLDGDLKAADLLVAFRDRDWDGWPCRAWKSGVKYGNAIAAGRPIITQACAAFEEIRPVGVIVEHKADIGAALDDILTHGPRQLAFEDGVRRAADYSLERIATHYTDMFDALLKGKLKHA